MKGLRRALLWLVEAIVVTVATSHGIPGRHGGNDNGISFGGGKARPGSGNHGLGAHGVGHNGHNGLGGPDAAFNHITDWTTTTYTSSYTTSTWSAVSDYGGADSNFAEPLAGNFAGRPGNPLRGGFGGNHGHHPFGFGGPGVGLGRQGGWTSGSTSTQTTTTAPMKTPTTHNGLGGGGFGGGLGGHPGNWFGGFDANNGQPRPDEIDSPSTYTSTYVSTYTSTWASKSTHGAKGSKNHQHNELGGTHHKMPRAKSEGTDDHLERSDDETLHGDGAASLKGRGFGAGGFWGWQGGNGHGGGKPGGGHTNKWNKGGGFGGGGHKGGGHGKFGGKPGGFGEMVSSP